MNQSIPIWRLVVLVLLGLTWRTPVLAEQRTALVIGNAAYGELGALRNPVNDATDMATALRQLSFDVTLLRDADLRTIQEAVETFVRRLRQGGIGLFYFAGHGMQVQGENYLIPLRSRINREQDVTYETVPVGRILGGMEDAGNQLNIIILDACRDNPYARQWRSVQRGLAVLQAARGSLIAYATAPGTVASDGSSRNGVYTEYLLKHLSTPGLSVEHLFKRVRVGVVEATKGKQTPWESSSLVGDFFFVPPAPVTAPIASSPVSPTAPVPLPSVPAGPDPEAAMWAMVEQSSRPQDAKAFLDTYPNGRFAPAAWLKFQQLQELAAQQRAEDDKRIAEQERQRREREAAEAQQRAEAQRREEERKRLEEAKRREEQTQKITPGTTPSPPPQVARLEPEPKRHARDAVPVPAATIRQVLAENPWTAQVKAFHMDLSPVSNREFLAFVQAHPQWKKSLIASDKHDGDYLKHWQGDDGVPARELDEPVRYVSYYAAAAYCKEQGAQLPSLGQYRIASGGWRDAIHQVDYATAYSVPAFHFMQTEWTNTWWDSAIITRDPGKRIPYTHGSLHNNRRGNRDYVPEQENRYTGRSLGFRCAR